MDTLREIKRFYQILETQTYYEALISIGDAFITL